MQPFQVWRLAVDAELADRTGMVSDDLPDQPYRDWYDDDMTPVEVVEEILEELNCDLESFNDMMEC